MVPHDPSKSTSDDSLSEIFVPVSGAPADSVSQSPRWGAATKLIVGLTLAIIILYLVSRFLNILGPLLLSVILAYLLYPSAEGLNKSLKIPWRAAVTILYLVAFLILVGSIALGGLALIDQVQNLIIFLQEAIKGLPAFLAEASSHPVQVGPFNFDFSLLDMNEVGQQLLSSVQPILATAGASVLSVASGAASVLGWIFFIMLISFFMLSESGGLRLISMNLPGYTEDIRRLSDELSRIWNAFLRGQLTIVLLTILLYTFLLGGLRMNFFFGLALLAGLARFIPYVGPFIAWTSYGLVAFFQGTTIFGLPPLGYAALVVVLAFLFDAILDNYVTPRLMSNVLRVHPAAVMISALVGVNLLGVIGMVLAAPVMATVKLFFGYVFAKLFDQDPWAGMEVNPPPSPLPPFILQMQDRYEKLRESIAKAQTTRNK